MKTGNGTVTTDTQFSVFLANKPLILAQIFQRLAQDKINIVALSMMDATEHGVLRLVVENTERARKSLTAVNVPMAETTVLISTLANRPGAIADVVERLASNHINVNYAYATSGFNGGKAVGVFRVSDIHKAAQVLAERKPRRKTEPAVRATPAGRRK